MESKTQSQLARIEQPFGMDPHLENCEFDQFLDAAEYGHNLLVIDITFGGMACGPVWYNLKFGFDYEVE